MQDHESAVQCLEQEVWQLPELPHEPGRSYLPQERHLAQLPHFQCSEPEKVQEDEPIRQDDHHPNIVPLVLNVDCKQKKPHYHHRRQEHHQSRHYPLELGDLESAQFVPRSLCVENLHFDSAAKANPPSSQTSHAMGEVCFQN